jgi:hypothetical protein
MNSKKFLVVLVLVGLFVTAGAFANNVGVGFGTVLMEGKEGKLFEILAVTTNGTSGSFTFAITSGTSGYKEGQKIGMAAVDVYIAENMDTLAVDIAKGEGDYLNTLAFLMKAQDKEAFNNLMHSNFSKIYASQDVTSSEVSETIKSLYFS